MREFQGVIGTDYSLYPEMSISQRIWNSYRNRVMDYYLQSKGITVIPVASWSTEEDFDWCLDGLPEYGSIAVSNNGCLARTYSKKIFVEGIQHIQKQKKPTNLVVCGRRMTELECYDNIWYYPSFSQRWKARMQNGR